MGLPETILAELKVALVRVDAGLRVVSADLGLASHLAGHARQGERLTDLFPELIGCEADLLAVACGRIPRFELPMINRPAHDAVLPCYLSLTAMPLPATPGESEGKEREGFLLLVRDVTAEGRLQQEVIQQLNELRLLRARLEAANARLLQLDEQKSAFLRMAAHDLRAPLTIIHGYVEMVLQGGRLAGDSETAEYLGVVLNRAGQMARLIDDLLDVEKIESGAVRFRRELVDLAALVAQVGTGFLPLAERRGQDLRWEVAPDLPRPHGDAERLAQVLNNLVSNAVKFTPEGGQVRIEAFRRDGEAVVEVSDTGPGISEADQAHLFERFFRTDDVRLRRIPGSGLGLSIARAIVEQHGGRVFCRSRLGAGSTFGFALPADATPPPNGGG